MNRNEFNRLMGYYSAKRGQREHMPLITSKRHVRGAGKGYGQILKTSFVKPQVGINKFFPEIRVAK